MLYLISELIAAIDNTPVNKRWGSSKEAARQRSYYRRYRR